MSFWKIYFKCIFELISVFDLLNYINSFSDCFTRIGLTIDQATDCDLLRNELVRLENDYKYLSVSYHTHYSSRTVEKDLKESLATSAISRDKLFDEIGILKQRQLKLMVAIQAAQAYLKIQPPHDTIGQAVTAALAREVDNIGSDTGVNYFTLTPLWPQLMRQLVSLLVR